MRKGPQPLHARNKNLTPKWQEMLYPRNVFMFWRPQNTLYRNQPMSNLSKDAWAAERMAAVRSDCISELAVSRRLSGPTDKETGNVISYAVIAVGGP